jgi:hypothetical protein
MRHVRFPPNVRPRHDGIFALGKRPGRGLGAGAGQVLAWVTTGEGVRRRSVACQEPRRRAEFEPELVGTMRSVLESAVDQIDAANRTPATKAKMAERILRVASDGITDPVMLTAMAIEEGTQPAD